MNFHANLKLHILTLTWQHHLDFIFSFKFSSTENIVQVLQQGEYYLVTNKMTFMCEFSGTPL